MIALWKHVKKHNIQLAWALLACVLTSTLTGYEQFISTNHFAHYCECHKPYQDVIIGGTVAYKGWNSQYCEERYDLIKNIIVQHMPKSPCTLLDVGASQGYFSFRLAHELDVECTMIENGQSAWESEDNALDFLTMLIDCNTTCRHKINLLPRTLSSELIIELNKHQHFDVVLALSVVHHLSDWAKFIDTLIQLGDLVIIEVPASGRGDLSHMANSKQLATINGYLDISGGNLVATIPRHFKGQYSNVYVMQTQTPH